MKRKLLSWALLGALHRATCYYLLFQPGLEQRSVFSAVRCPGQTVVIDAGHGGEDGGAVSLSGVPESGINLSIALKLDQILGLYGVAPVLLRSEDVSLHDSSAQTLREKKVSDLHNRVAVIEAAENATLISIHQNTFQGALLSRSPGLLCQSGVESSSGAADAGPASADAGPRKHQGAQANSGHGISDESHHMPGHPGGVRLSFESRGGSAAPDGRLSDQTGIHPGCGLAPVPGAGAVPTTNEEA